MSCENAIEDAVQIIWEYPNWTAEHIDDWMRMLESSVHDFDGDELYHVCKIAENIKIIEKITSPSVLIEMLEKKVMD